MRPYLGDPWRTAQAAPSRLAVSSGSERCTFGELVNLADRLAVGIRSLGAPDGAMVATDLPCGPRFFALTLAAFRYGLLLFPVPHHLCMADTSLPERERAYVFVTAGSAGGAWSAVSVDDLIRPRRGGRLEPAARGGTLVFATSGTTGEPTVVRRARPWYRYRGVAVDERYAAGITCGPHLMANPTYHLGTLGPALYALQAGSAVIVQRDWSPSGFADLAETFEADSAFLSPDRLLDVTARRCWPARGPRVVMHGGASCAPAVKRAAIDVMGPVLHEFYGTSECVVSEISTEDWLRRPGSVGRPLPGVRVEIRTDGERLPPEDVGEIWIRPRAVDRRDPSAGAWTATGDLGYLDDDGYLFLLGRASDTSSVPLARFEHAVRCIDGVADAAVAADGTPTCLVERLPQWPADLPARVRGAAIAGEVGPLRIDIRPIGSFPRTRSGKLRRVSG